VSPQRQWGENNGPSKADARMTNNAHNIHNGMKAARALRALRHHKSRERLNGEMLVTDDIVQLLADVMHLCDRWFENAKSEPYTGANPPKGLDPTYIWRKARKLHKEEVLRLEESVDDDEE